VLVDTPSTGGDRIYDHAKLSRVLSQIVSEFVAVLAQFSLCFAERQESSEQACCDWLHCDAGLY